MSRAVTIRSIQHYLYCPRRYGLLEINRDWQENALVANGDLVHERVHSGEHEYSDKNGFCRSNVELYNDELDIYGKADCVEFERSGSAEYSPLLGGRYAVRLIEYKPSKPKSALAERSDAIQCFAQKVCADSIFGVSCEGFMYYADVRRRVRLPFDTQYGEYYALLTDLLSQMRSVLESGTIPPRAKGQSCSGCSIESVCLPKTGEYSVRDEILKIAWEDV